MPRSTPILLALAAACTGTATLYAQSGPTLDACSVLTREEIETVTGKDPGPPDPSGTGDPTNCRYPEGRAIVDRVTLYAKVDPKEPKGLALKQLRDRGMKARAVDGLGDDAVFLEDDDETPSGHLFVRVGHWRLVMSRDAEPKAAAGSTLPVLTGFAKAAIAKLR
jgi:hypothetical protein